jgi:hypothetical protein
MKYDVRYGARKESETPYFLEGCVARTLVTRYRHHLILSYLDDRLYKPMFYVKGADSADSR